MIRHILLMLLALLPCVRAAEADREAAVNEILARLPLRLRTRLMLGGNYNDPGQGKGIFNQTTACARKEGMPFLNLSDGPMGVNALGSGTSFGSGLILASTWNRELVRQVGKALGEEALAKNVQVILAPAVNLNRDLANGRTFEYFSEDPYLSGQVGAAYVRGVQSCDVMVTVKHYLANNQEKNRNFVSSNVSERALHELYLAPFRAAVVEGGAWSAMTAANRVNGVFVSDNRYFLTNLLKYDYGMPGIVLTDWCNVRTGAVSARAGTDLAMPYRSVSPYRELENLVRSGRLAESAVDDAVQRLVRTAFLTKATAVPGFTPADRKQGGRNIAAHQAVARRMAEEGIILLKNRNSLLPLDEKKLRSLALIGKYADFRFYGHRIGGSGWTAPPYQSTPLSGLRSRLGGRVKLLTPAYDEKNMPETRRRAVEAARSADYAVIFAGLNSRGPGNPALNPPDVWDVEDGDRGNLDFPPEQLELIREVAAVCPGRVIVVLSGSVFEVRDWIDSVDAVLHTFYAGMEGGNAVADILLGRVNPSGKLPHTWPRRYCKTAGFVSGRPESDQRELKEHDVFYSEGSAIGYRHYDLRKLTPEFAFGHGLSYTRFEYGEFKLSSRTFAPGGTVTAAVAVANSGRRRGREVVQLYAVDCRTRARRLAGFEKIELAPGESRTGAFTVDPAMFGRWEPQAHSFITAAGEYELQVGSASDDIRRCGSVTLTADTPPDPDYRVIQAEAGSGSEGVRRESGREVDGEALEYLVFDTDRGEAAWEIDVPEPGEYSVIVRYSNDGYSGPTQKSHGPVKSGKLALDGEACGEYVFQNTRHANVWNYDSVDVMLAAGKHRLALLTPAESRGLRVDKLILQRIRRRFPKPAPRAPDAPVPVSAQESGDGIAWFPQNASGKGWTELASRGKRLTLDLPADTAVAHRIALRYVNDGDVPAPCAILVNGVPAGRLLLPPTGGPECPEVEETANTVPLTSGINVVTVIAAERKVRIAAVGRAGGMGDPDVRPPELRYSRPAAGGTVTRREPVTLYFSEAVEPGRVAGKIILRCGSEAIPFELVAEEKTVKLVPGREYIPDRSCTVEIPAGAFIDRGHNPVSGEANPLAEPCRISFAADVP